MPVASAPIAVLLVLAILTIFFVQPDNMPVIFLLIIIIAALIFYVVRLIFPRRYAVLAALLTGSLLTLSALGVFDIINVSLCLSFFIGLGILLK